MFDHQFEEHPVELRPFRRGQRLHLGRRQHARHHRRHVVTAMHCRIVRLFAMRGQPLAHERDLVFLRQLDLLRVVDGFAVLRPVGHEIGHLQGLVVVEQHVLHKHDVRFGIARVRISGCGPRIDGARFLTRRARLHDRGILRGERCRERHGRREKSNANLTNVHKTSAVMLTRDDCRELVRRRGRAASVLMAFATFRRH